MISHLHIKNSFEYKVLRLHTEAFPKIEVACSIPRDASSSKRGEKGGGQPKGGKKEPPPPKGGKKEKPPPNPVHPNG